MGRGSGTKSTVLSFTADLSDLSLNIDGRQLCAVMGVYTYADVKLNSGDLSIKGNLFTESHYFAQSPNLSTDSLQTIAESIGECIFSGSVISFKSTAYDKLTDEQKSLIASKNWSINRVA